MWTRTESDIKGNTEQKNKLENNGYNILVARTGYQVLFKGEFIHGGGVFGKNKIKSKKDYNMYLFQAVCTASDHYDKMCEAVPCTAHKNKEHKPDCSISGCFNHKHKYKWGYGSFLKTVTIHHKTKFLEFIEVEGKELRFKVAEEITFFQTQDSKGMWTICEKFSGQQCGGEYKTLTLAKTMLIASIKTGNYLSRIRLFVHEMKNFTNGKSVQDYLG